MYADADDLAAYLAGGPAAPELPADPAGLLEDAERYLDVVLGGPRDPATGRAYAGDALAALTDAQRQALRDATCAMAEWMLLLGPD